MIQRAEGYKPVFTEPFRLWTIKEARKRYPGLSGFVEFEDLLQEGAFVFAKLCHKYKPYNAAHMMALYKTAYVRHLINLGHKVYKQRVNEVQVSDAAVSAAADNRSLAGIPGAGFGRQVARKRVEYN